MKDELFDELLESVREGGAILHGDIQPARRTEIPTPNVIELRKVSGLSQRDFALALGISAATLRNWEQKRREPTGAGRVLLHLAQKNPQFVFESISDLLGEHETSTSEA